MSASAKLSMTPARSIQNNRRGVWCWSSMAIFTIALLAGPAVAFFQFPHGGDESMAAGLAGAYVAGTLMLVGLLVATIAFVRERDRPVLRWVSLLIYVVPLAVLLGAVAVGFIHRK
jgi:hypothetical protein